MTISRAIQRYKTDITGYLFIAPAVLMFAVFLIYPAFEAIRISLYRVSLHNSVFVGLDNFIQLAQDPAFRIAFVNTFKYVLYIVPATVLFSVIVAVAISNKREGITAFYRGVFYLPHIASAVTISLIWSWIYNPVIGIANHTLSLAGIPPQEWLSSPETAFGSVAFVILTASVGQPIILYTAALGGISREYYEAAEIDGASRLRQFTSITWPLLKPTTLYILVISTISVFQIFVFVQLLTRGGPTRSTTTIIYELYEVAFVNHNYSYASAMGVVLFFFVGIVAYFQFKFMSAKADA